ncbi:hypothetical protein THAOC_17963, partial [Thalassiosira oceanica]
MWLVWHLVDLSLGYYFTKICNLGQTAALGSVGTTCSCIHKTLNFHLMMSYARPAEILKCPCSAMRLLWYGGGRPGGYQRVEGWDRQHGAEPERVG